MMVLDLTTEQAEALARLVGHHVVGRHGPLHQIFDMLADGGVNVGHPLQGYNCNDPRVYDVEGK
jgi:hypothetical protein